jgi:hypothetical protein
LVTIVDGSLSTFERMLRFTFGDDTPRTHEPEPVKPAGGVIFEGDRTHVTINKGSVAAALPEVAMLAVAKPLELPRRHSIIKGGFGGEDIEVLDASLDESMRAILRAHLNVQELDTEPPRYRLQIFASNITTSDSPRCPKDRVAKLRYKVSERRAAGDSGHGFERTGELQGVGCVDGAASLQNVDMSATRSLGGAIEAVLQEGLKPTNGESA